MRPTSNANQQRIGARLAALSLLLAACGGAAGGTSSTTPVIETTTTSTSTTMPTTTTTEQSTTTTTQGLPAFPPEADGLEHGGYIWAVVLAGSEDFDDPTLAQAIANAEDAGYTTGATDCDHGASEALGLPDDGHYYTVSVYLGSEADARQSQAAFDARSIGGIAAEIQTFCLD